MGAAWEIVEVHLAALEAAVEQELGPDSQSGPEGAAR